MDPNSRVEQDRGPRPPIDGLLNVRIEDERMLVTRITLAALAALALSAGAYAQSPLDESPLPAVYLAWYGESGVEWTVAITETVDGFERLDEWRGIHIAHGDHIWHLDELAYWRDTLNCRCAFDQDDWDGDRAPEECQFRTLDQQPVVRSLSDDTILPLVPQVPDSREYEYGGAFEVLGSVGPRIFIRHGTWEYYCGAAHGDSDAAFSVYDIRSQSQVSMAELLEDEALAAAVQDTREAAWQAFADESFLDDDRAALEPTLIFPTFGGEQVGWTVQWTGGACYACGDHLWSAYSTSQRVPVAAAGVLGSPDRVPPAVRALAESMSSNEIRGWSRIEPESVMHPLLRDAESTRRVHTNDELNEP